MNKTDYKTEFEHLLPKGTSEEAALLEASIRAEGIREPIRVWNDTIIDGHRRYRLALKHKLKFEVAEMVFMDRAGAELWIFMNQLSRRNLPPEHYAYYRGKMYEAEKLTHGGNRASDQSDHLKGSTRDAVAKKHGVSAGTIARDSAFARGLDILEEKVPGSRQKVLSGHYEGVQFDHICDATKSAIAGIALATGKERDSYIEGFKEFIQGRGGPPQPPAKKKRPKPNKPQHYEPGYEQDEDRVVPNPDDWNEAQLTCVLDRLSHSKRDAIVEDKAKFMRWAENHVTEADPADELRQQAFNPEDDDTSFGE
jgi:hypothetical protein